MIFFTGCLKCGGDLQLQRDRYGTYIQCFQCASINEILLEIVTVNHRVDPTLVRFPLASIRSHE